MERGRRILNLIRPDLFTNSSNSTSTRRRKTEDKQAKKNVDISCLLSLEEVSPAEKVYHYLQTVENPNDSFNRNELAADSDVIKPYDEYELDVGISITRETTKLDSENECTNLLTQHSVAKSSSKSISSSSSSSFVPPSSESTKTSRNSIKEIPIQSPIVTSVKLSANKDLNTEKNFCCFCFDEVGHFSRHLFRKHTEEESVKKILQLPVKSKDRRDAIVALRKKGNFLLMNEKSKLIPSRRPPKEHSTILNVDNRMQSYVPCVNCLGYFKKSYLWRHNKVCKAKSDDKNCVSRKQHLSESQTFLTAIGLLGNYLLKSRLKLEVFSIMRPDEISVTAKADPLICLYGESYLNKHKRKQMNVVVSNKMRELARLLIVLKESTSIKCLMSALKPELYHEVVSAAKIISGYNPSTQTFKASSLALHLGTSLKFLCDIAKKAIITKHYLFEKFPKDETLKNITEIRDIITNHWCNDLSSLANKVLNEQKWIKPKLIPVTEDVMLFNQYITAKANQAFKELTNNENMEKNYKLLSECTLALVLTFNRKRMGEVQFLDINSYERTFVNIQQECTDSLSEVEKTLCEHFKRVVVFGKGNKPVPILFTKKMQEFVKLLLKIRKSNGLVPECNNYVFANIGSPDRWMSAQAILRKFAKKCGAKNPELLTSTRFRKQIATILQLMNFEKNEMEQIARFMGHTEKTHLEFYRQSDDIYQTAKVAKVLMLLNSGKGSELKGKTLENLEINDEIEIEIEEKNDTQELNNTTENPLECDSTNDEHASSKSVSTGSNFKSDNLKTRTSNRIRWSAQQKKVVTNYFKIHIKKKKAPKKNECLDLILKHPKLFSEKDWVRIKTFVYNTYRNLH